MFSGNSLLAVIPARGGSKGLPDKNIAHCAGKPLIHWTIEAAKKSSYIDQVFVSTDSERIANISRQADVHIPFLRPSELAEDHSSLLDAIKHAWEAVLDENGKQFDYVLVLQPTSPLRNEVHIDNAISTFFQLKKTNQDTLASVYEVGQKYGWLMNLNDQTGYIKFCMDVASTNPQRQKLSKYFLPNGAIFMAKGVEVEQGFYGKNTIPYIMELKESVDIDTSVDLEFASDILRKNILNGARCSD